MNAIWLFLNNFIDAMVYNCFGFYTVEPAWNLVPAFFAPGLLAADR